MEEVALLKRFFFPISNWVVRKHAVVVVVVVVVQSSKFGER